MAKAKKRVATRKKSSKRGKASAKSGRKRAAKRAMPKEAKSKVGRAGSEAPKPAVKKKRPKTAARKAPRKTPRQLIVPVEDTIINMMEEPVPGVVVVTESEIDPNGYAHLVRPRAQARRRPRDRQRVNR